jgi:hypothetical protein
VAANDLIEDVLADARNHDAADEVVQQCVEALPGVRQLRAGGGVGRCPCGLRREGAAEGRVACRAGLLRSVLERCTWCW